MKRSLNASKILTIWSDACSINSSEANKWYVGKKTYMWEESNREYPDGAISGTVFLLSAGDRRATSSFRIDADGAVVRAPAFLKNASLDVEKELVSESYRMRVHEDN